MFEAISADGSARRLGGAVLDAEIVDEAARAALASVFDVGEETISLSSTSFGNVWRVEYALVAKHYEILVARDTTQGMADGSGVLEAALFWALAALSAQLVPGSVFADRGEVLFGNHGVTNTLTSTTTASTTTATIYQPSAIQLDGDGTQEASTVVVLYILGALCIGGVALVACFTWMHRKLRGGHQRKKDMNGFDSISPTSAWGDTTASGGTVSGVSGIPPLKEGHHKDLQPGLLPEFHVIW